MTLDSEEQRAMLLELLAKATFPGVAARKVVELQDAIESASVEVADTSRPQRLERVG